MWWGQQWIFECTSHNRPLLLRKVLLRKVLLLR